MRNHTLKEGEPVDKIVRISGGLLLGFLVGAGTVVLLAPRSGAETRYAIQERVEAVLEAGRQAADERRLELTAQLEDLRQPGLSRGRAGAEGL
jgi:gas vesicle protein